MLNNLCVCVQCKMWSYGGVCHCNSHKRSDFWNNLRNGLLLGGLKTFNLTVSEIDSHLRLAGTCAHTHTLWGNPQPEPLIVSYLLPDSLDLSSSRPDTMLQSFRQGLSEKFLSTVKAPEQWGVNQWNQKSPIFEWVAEPWRGYRRPSRWSRTTACVGDTWKPLGFTLHISI